MVFCPFEPKNAVLKSKLDDHLKTCPKKREIEEIQKKPWFKDGINFCNRDASKNETQLKDIDPEKVETVVRKINDLF
jgi:hypothetical protein